MASQKQSESLQKLSKIKIFTNTSANDSWSYTVKKMVKFVDYAFNKLGKQHKKALSQHQDQIRDYFWMNKIDGEAFHNTKKQQFIINISKHIACQQNKQKMNALASLWAFINFAHTVPKKKGESRSAFSTPATSPKPPTHTPS
eukprot:281825_1